MVKVETTLSGQCILLLMLLMPQAPGYQTPQPIHGYLLWINGYVPIVSMGEGDAEPEGERAMHGHDCLHTKTNANTLSAFAFTFVGEQEGVG